MRKSLFVLAALLFSGAVSAHSGHRHAQTALAAGNDYPIHPVSFTAVRLTDAFWAPRLTVNQQVTIPIALDQCYSTGRVDNFLKAAGVMPGYFNTGYTFDDTDIYKIIEGASYSIRMLPNAALEARIDTLITYIQQAQEPDGYLYTARTAGEPGNMHKWVGLQRWEWDPDLSHELYNCGHLYEAAVAHYQSTGKRTLLDVAIKNADLLVRDFGPGKLAYEPGHQIVEMGLAKMYRVTGKKEYLDLAKFFLDVKGNGVRGAYCQSHKPVIEQDEAVGHAVRAGYMYSGMADVAALTGDASYLNAIDKIWENVVGKKLYLTGGIGATNKGEAFGENYELPNATAYCETCAAISNVYWNHRLFLLHGEAKYYDVLERTLYNGLISGISLAGNTFFYPNPLQSTGKYKRSEWFGCACCPSNLCRFIPSVPGYFYAVRDDKIYVNLFAESDATIDLTGKRVALVQKTQYPWDGNVALTVNPEKSGRFDLKIRIPGWARNTPVPSDLYTYHGTAQSPVTVKVNGQAIDATPGPDGYLTLDRTWNKADRVEIVLPMTPRYVAANPRVAEDAGKTAIERGPIVYCFEGVDNAGEVLSASLPSLAIPINESFQPQTLGGIVQLSLQGSIKTETAAPQTQAKPLIAIPYYAWANRTMATMTVWLPVE